MINKDRVLGFMLSFVAVTPMAFAQDPDDSRQSDAGSYNYVGDDVRIGLGYNTDTKLTGEFFWSFAEEADSAWIAEGWFGDEGAGGVKLNHHWLTGGVEAGVDGNGNTVYSDGRVRKLFIAADRNAYDDGKVSFGGGSEHKNRFWSLYGSLATTGERYLGQTTTFRDLLVNGVQGSHAFTRTDTLQTITDYFAHPYDWGAGFRVGRYFDNALVRLRGGLDYESGDYSTSQITAFAGLDKRFRNSAHGLSFRAEFLHKSGAFEVDEDDFRVTAMWTWEFGESFRPARVYRDVERQRIPDASELPREERIQVVQNRVTLDNTASFALDSATLNDEARAALDDVLTSLGNVRVAGNINIVGHTCYLGSEAYNQDLSERRAKAVFNYLTANGVDTGVLRSEGRGELEPRYSNETEETRRRNRRVEISFIAEEEVATEVIVGEGQPITEWVQEPVPAEAAWIRRALRNPVVHKRSVDFYRYNQVRETTITGTPVFENTGPSAVDDVYSVDQDSTGNSLAITVNDSDPEGDTLTVVSVTNPAHGEAQINGNMISYTPDSGFFGTDQFSYTVEDGFGGSATAMVTIHVEPLNDPPVAVDDQFMVQPDSSGNMLDVLDNDSDPEGDDIMIVSVSTPMSGTASINGSMVSYTPNPGFTGNDSFSYTIKDTFGGEASAQVSITVENAPPVAVDDYAVTLKGYSEVIDVLANDYDPDGDQLTVVEIIQSAHKMGTVTINADGTLTYKPMANWWGGDSFQYRISDGNGGEAVATVTVDVTTLITKP